MPSLKIGEKIFARVIFFCQGLRTATPTDLSMQQKATGKYPSKNYRQQTLYDLMLLEGIKARIKSLEVAIRQIFNPGVTSPQTMINAEMDHGEMLKDQYFTLDAVRAARIALLKKHDKDVVEEQLTEVDTEQKKNNMRRYRRTASVLRQV